MNAASFSLRLGMLLTALSFLSPVTAEEPTTKPPPDGVKQTFNQKGKLIAEETYLGGVLNGPSKKWDERGILHEGSHKNGKMDGLWRENRENVWASEKTYRDGILHGPCNTRSVFSGNTDGQYVNGEKDGQWMKTSGRLYAKGETVQHFKRGIRDGKWSYTSVGLKEPVEITFKDGQVVDMPAELKNLPLFDRMNQLTGPGKPRDEVADNTIDILLSQSDFKYTEVPLSEVTEDLREMFSLAVCPDRFALARNKATLKSPITTKEGGIPVILGLARLAKQHGLTLDYQYHVIWLTRKDMAENWKGDPTGTMALAPPKESSLAKALSVVPSHDRMPGPPGSGANPSDLFVYLEKDQGVKIEFSAAVKHQDLIDTAQRIGVSCPHLTVRELLAATLYQSGCVCSERNGTLVIVPQTPVQ